MIQFIRRFFDSKFGIPVTLGFLALIAVAFASADISGTGTFGGLSGGDRVAVVGDQKIGTADLSRSATNALDQVRQQNPSLSMPAFLAQGGLEEVLDQIIDRAAIAEFARSFGLRAGDNLVNSEIVQIGAFRGPDGNFSQEIYRAAIAQQGLNDAQVRADLGEGLLAQQILVPAAFGARMPDKLVSQYAALLAESRQGTIGVVPSALYAPTAAPTAAQLQAHYERNRANYIRPERRVIRFATFDAEAVAGSAEPTDAAIAARYQQDRARYAASESRTVSQLIVPTQQAANALRQQVAGGQSLAAAASQAGFQVAAIGPVTREQLAAQTSAAVAQAAFAANEGTVAAPARSGLGWHVVRVDQVERTAGRTLAQAREEIAATLREDNRRRAIAELSASIEERLDDGESLADIAREIGAQVQTTPPIVAEGLVYGTAETAPAVLAPALQTAFQMEEGEPQIAEVVAGETFLMFEVSEITQSATAPLAEIRADVTADWRLTQGLARARAAADRILARLKRGGTLAEAMRAENAALTDIDPIDLTREDLARQGGRVPPPLALMFSMAEGTSKRLEAPGKSGWFLVDLDQIETGTVARDNPLYAQARQELGQALGREYGDQFRAAIREAVGVERNQVAIDAVRRQLSGAGAN
jgi:peptidyl-prolyl cis-trans isomerase D